MRMSLNSMFMGVARLFLGVEGSKSLGGKTYFLVKTYASYTKIYSLKIQRDTLFISSPLAVLMIVLQFHFCAAYKRSHNGQETNTDNRILEMRGGI